MSRIRLYNPKTKKLNLSSTKHCRKLIEDLLAAHLFEGVFIKDPNSIIGLIKLVITCLQNEQQELLEKTIRDLESQLQSNQ